MAGEFPVGGANAAAAFTLKLHRGDGMVLLAMNWRDGLPPNEFVGFAIEYKEPGGDRYYVLKNRLGFAGADGSVGGDRLSTLKSPIQKFRWVHFPRNAELSGAFLYRVTPVFMNAADELSYGEPQSAAIELRRETYPGVLNVTFTRGFVSSQAFVDRYQRDGHTIADLLPKSSSDGLHFKPTHPEAEQALAWMGFEARDAILELLDRALTEDKQAQVSVVAYDLSEAGVVSRLEKLGKRLRIIIDDSAEHGEPHSGETQAAARLAATAGAKNVKRQHMGRLQHNKTIIVDGPKVKAAVCGSTNFTWRGFFVQSNNAVIVQGAAAVAAFMTGFDAYWNNEDGFGDTSAATWLDLGLPGLDAKVTFSPHSLANACLDAVGLDVSGARSSVFYSLAFLGQTKGPIRDAVTKVTNDPKIFVYGISDKKAGLELQKPDGVRVPVHAAALTRNVPEPFKSEPNGLAGAFGNRMHHKFVVVDFNRPTARVYLGSYNFSGAADTLNGENLVVIRDRRVAVSYMVEALRIFDHYHFRVAQEEAKRARRKLALKRPPRGEGETAWWRESYTNPLKVQDRELFA